MGWFSRSSDDFMLLHLNAVQKQIALGFARIERTLNEDHRAIMRRMSMAQADIDALKVAVEAEGSAVTAAVTLIEGLAQQIRDSLDDPAELKALADSINSQAKALADAVVANTPASPTP